MARFRQVRLEQLRTLDWRDFAAGRLALLVGAARHGVRRAQRGDDADQAGTRRLLAEIYGCREDLVEDVVRVRLGVLEWN